MSIWKNYHLATSIQDALRALQEAPGDARLISGGTDLLLDLQQGRHAPVNTLVDVTRVAEMRCLEVRQDRLFIGAAAPLNQIVAAELVRRNAEALHEACGLIGGPQVRNIATLGGNVGHALPAADGTIALMALDAQAEVASLDGTRSVAMNELFAGPGRSALSPRGEMITGFSLALRKPGQASAFKRVMRPQGVAIAILNMAVWVHRGPEDTIEDVRIAIGPAGPTPLRAQAAEVFLRGQVYHEVAIEKAVEILLGEAHLRTSPHRATAEYRRSLAGVLLRQTLQAAWERAGGGGGG
jgi:carbon-monoxide dehydrogenase medium subunit